MGEHLLKVSSWNVRGLSAPHRVDIVSKWARFRQRGTKIIALQEMISEGPNLERALRRIMPDCHIVIDHNPNGIADFVLLIDRTLPILEQGCSGKGYAVWVKIRLAAGVIGIMGVHGPSHRSNRPEAWEWAHEVVREGKWVIIGDFNMVERRTDTLGPSPLIRGEELRRWALCSNLLDTWPADEQSMGSDEHLYGMVLEMAMPMGIPDQLQEEDLDLEVFTA
ncbi:hypothetical protein R1sor_009847 [Riccia sorocarpa]|uniref:Endonuclease/exonuclease/phosphatase domain-containing protein n=1 Tax=Riccia sorocarpa TaxID=122646 RepID=A0ABD3I0D0_9MARC